MILVINDLRLVFKFVVKISLMLDIEYKYYLIELIPRVFCGIIFLFQGYDKLFKVKIQGVVEEMEERHK